MKKLIVVLLFFVGCTTGAESVIDTQIDTNIFQLTYSGTSWDNKQTGSDYLLLKAADITLEHGFKYFILKESSDSSAHKINKYGNIEERPRLSNTIECYKDKPQTTELAYNAEITRKNIKAKYDMQD